MTDKTTPVGFDRIFHIGRECYIVYLGVDENEIRPFLRIGNKEKIPQKILDVTATTVLSASLTGNPLREKFFLQQPHNSYIGDPKLVKRYEKFFSKNRPPANRLVDYKHVKEGPSRDYLTFYSNGNICLYGQGDLLFDLNKREKIDHHQAALAESIRKLIGKNPFKILAPSKVFQGFGVVFVGGGVLLYRKGALMGAFLPPDSFVRLVAEGIDPALLRTLFVEVDADDPVSGEMLIHFMKERQGKEEKVEFLSTARESLERVLNLFPEKETSLGVARSVREFSPDKPLQWSGVELRSQGKGFIVKAPELSSELLVGTTPVGTLQGDVIQISSSGNHVVLPRRKEIFSFRIPSGIPCNFQEKPLPSQRELSDRYFYSQCAVLSDLLDGLIGKVVQQIRQLFEELEQRGDGVLLSKTTASIKKLLANTSLPPESPLYFFFHNCQTLLIVLEKRMGGVSKEVQEVQKGLGAFLKRSVPPEGGYGFFCDFYGKETSALLYRTEKIKLSKGELEAYSRFLKLLESEAAGNLQKYREEEIRLLNFIKSLQSPKASPFRAKAAAKETAATSVGGDFDKAKSTTGAVKGEAASSKVTPPKKKAIPRYPKSGFARWWWVCLLVLLLGLGTFWLYSPWDLKDLWRRSWGPWGSASAGRPEKGQDGSGRIGPFTEEGKKLLGIGEKGEKPSSQELQTPRENEGKENSQKSVGEGEESQTELDSEETHSKMEESSPSSVTESPEDVSEGDKSLSPSGTESSEEGIAGDSAVLQRDRPPAQANVPPTEVDPDQAPRTQNEVRRYLDLGRYSITIRDIIHMTNRIAVASGYDNLAGEGLGADPNLIFRGVQLELPDGTTYVVRRGDAIWFIAARYIRVKVQQDIQNFEKLKERLSQKTNKREQEKALLELKKLKDESVSEKFTQEVTKVINRYE